LKPRNREISIFNISMLDVISGALGAVLIIMIVLLPYYKKESIDFVQEIQEMQQQLETSRQEAIEAQQQVEEAQQQAEQAEQQARQAQTQAEENRQRAMRAEQKLSKTFLVVYIRWATVGPDVDLFVKDPSGAEFYFDKRTISGRPGEFSEDSKLGPGNEVWEIRDAPPGEYHISVWVYPENVNGKAPTILPTVEGKVFFRDGTKTLPQVKLTGIKEKKHMAIIIVKSDGSVQVR
jgi:hypothetical protein